MAQEAQEMAKDELAATVVKEKAYHIDQINKQFIIQFLQNRTIAYICFLFSILYGWMQLCQYKK